MIFVTEEFVLIQTIEQQLIGIQQFITKGRHQSLEEVPMDELMEQLAQLDVSLKALNETSPIQKEEVTSQAWEQLEAKRLEVKHLFAQTIKDFESWREAALAEGQTVNLKVKAGRSYNQMKRL